MEKFNELNGEQKAFCIAFVKTNNATEAHKMVYGLKGKYSRDYHKIMACKLRKEYPIINEYIKYLQNYVYHQEISAGIYGFNKLNKKQRLFIENYVSTGDIKRALELSGYKSLRYVYSLLKDPRGREYIEILKKRKYITNQIHPIHNDIELNELEENYIKEILLYKNISARNKNILQGLENLLEMGTITENEFNEYKIRQEYDMYLIYSKKYDMFKIGKSKDIEERLRGLRLLYKENFMNIIIIPNGGFLENYIKIIFNDIQTTHPLFHPTDKDKPGYNMSGYSEWYEYNENLFNFIYTISKNGVSIELYNEITKILEKADKYNYHTYIKPMLKLRRK